MVKDKPTPRWINFAVGLGCAVFLAGLILPAINTPRPTHSAVCKNNLRQLAIAANSFHSQKGRLPTYLVDYGNFQTGPSPDVRLEQPTRIPRHKKLGTLAVSILPYLDQQVVYERWSTAKYPILTAETASRSGPWNKQNKSDIAFHPASAPNIPTYRCPNSESQSGNSYIANTGLSVRENAMSFAETQSPSLGVFHNGFAGLDSNGQPVATYTSMTLDDINDGLAHTIMFSENLQASPWYRPGFATANDLVYEDAVTEIDFPNGARFAQGMVWQQDENSDSELVLGINQTNDRCDLKDLVMNDANAAQLARPSSLHGGGVNIALADGSVRFLSDTVDPTVYKTLLSPNDQEAGLVTNDKAISDVLAQE